ncbi:MotA/TolQ/ExbB proton channel family protein [Agaribacterium haliotis]|uniref:MotA/TolQ/ExbB proton channel family protein n=1 Tax=Agaribacterium haliotis TaxID=2013869 RepID=UPI000BB55226|nr:MotA/TolQ/ExbB proton channel family protein [Agaribacterium haliotis]
MLVLMDLFADVLDFVNRGGWVLYVIASAAFIMWTLLFERFWFYKGELNRVVNGALSSWEARPERKSWNAQQIRRSMISEVNEKINANLELIATIVALCPLLGLLGTVTGMIEVFGVLAATGGGDAKSMASGVSKATIPTMAGMVAALSGVFGQTLVNQIATRESQLLEDHLTMDH